MVLRFLLLLLAVTPTVHAQCHGAVCTPWPSPGHRMSHITLRIGLTRASPAADLTLLSIQDQKEWSTEVSSAELGEVHTIVVPRGDYLLSIKAPHHRTMTKVINAIHADVDLATLRLAPANIVEGIIESDDGPVAEAAVEAGSRHATTDARGHYAVDLTNEEWPAYLVASHPGFGRHMARLPELPSDYVCPPIHLQPPGTVRVNIHLLHEHRPLIVQLGLRGAVYPLWLVQKHLTNSRSAVFSDLEPGQYLIAVNGTEPLQRTALTVNVKANETSVVTVEVPESVLRGRLFLGSMPLAAASVKFSHEELGWSRAVLTDATGRFRSRIWSRGTYKLTIAGGGIRSPRGWRATMPAAANEELMIRLPARTITGRVVDSKGLAVRGATVSLRSEFGDLGQVRRDTTGGNGSFEFDAVSGEQQTLSVEASGYLRGQDIAFSMPEAAFLHNVEIAVDSGLNARFRVTDSIGAPVTGAIVISASTTSVRAVETSNSEGWVNVPVDRRAQNTIYVFSPEGSIAVYGASEIVAHEHRIVVLPNAAASLLVRTLKPDSSPMANVSLLLRYEGALIPSAVTDELRQRRVMLLTSSADGEVRIPRVPAGTYEFWPYATDEEASDLETSVTSEPAPILVHAAPGLNEVTIRFEERDAKRIDSKASSKQHGRLGTKTPHSLQELNRSTYLNAEGQIGSTRGKAPPARSTLR